MNRVDLQILTDDRVADATALLEAGRWAAAYYLLGYAIECALKVCIAERFREHEIPEKSLLNDFYTHRLDKLVLTAAKDEFVKKTAIAPEFQENWDIIDKWTEASRYDHAITESKARDLHRAVCDPERGVLAWLKTLW